MVGAFRDRVAATDNTYLPARLNFLQHPENLARRHWGKGYALAIWPVQHRRELGRCRHWTRSLRPARPHGRRIPRHRCEARPSRAGWRWKKPVRAWRRRWRYSYGFEGSYHYDLIPPDKLPIAVVTAAADQFRIRLLEIGIPLFERETNLIRRWIEEMLPFRPVPGSASRSAR